MAEIDQHHVVVRYDARDRDQWLAVDEIYEAVLNRSTVVGNGRFLQGPINWMVVHFDYGACGWTGPAGLPPPEPPGRPEAG